MDSVFTSEWTGTKPMERKVLLTVEDDQGRHAYVEEFGKAYVVGGDMSAEQALIVLARQLSYRSDDIEIRWAEPIAFDG